MLIRNGRRIGHGGLDLGPVDYAPNDAETFREHDQPAFRGDHGIPEVDNAYITDPDAWFLTTDLPGPSPRYLATILSMVAIVAVLLFLVVLEFVFSD